MTAREALGPKTAETKLAKVLLLGMDVDGVLTDGTKIYAETGLSELVFYTRDGLGIYLLLKAGVLIALVSNGSSPVVRARARDLAIPFVYEGIDDKGTAMRSLMREVGVERTATAFIGDDIWDLAAFEEVGLAIAVADAVPRVKEAADLVTTARGGKGAVREVADMMLSAKRIEAMSLLGSNDAE